MNGLISYAVICLSLAGSLIAFLWFNLFSKKFKIFLGDTGSMLIGFLLAVFVIRILETGTDKGALKTFTSAPAIAFSILILPLFDTLRICIVRLFQGKSIFRSDNNHIHHYVLRISGTHLKATIAMLFVNIALIIMTILNRELGNIPLVLLNLAIVTGISLSLYFYLRKHPLRNNSYKE